MNLFTFSRGLKQNVDRAINDLQAQYFEMHHEKEKDPIHAQFQVRPWQMWEFAFPAKHLNTVLATISYRENKFYHGQERYFNMLRKILKLKEIPKLDYAKTPRRAIMNKGIGWHHIGIKEDKFSENGTEML